MYECTEVESCHALKVVQTQFCWNSITTTLFFRMRDKLAYTQTQYQLTHKEQRIKLNSWLEAAFL